MIYSSIYIFYSLIYMYIYKMIMHFIMFLLYTFLNTQVILKSFTLYLLNYESKKICLMMQQNFNMQLSTVYKVYIMADGFLFI